MERRTARPAALLCLAALAACSRETSPHVTGAARLSDDARRAAVHDALRAQGLRVLPARGDTILAHPQSTRTGDPSVVYRVVLTRDASGAPSTEMSATWPTPGGGAGPPAAAKGSPAAPCDGPPIASDTLGPWKVLRAVAADLKAR